MFYASCNLPTSISARETSESCVRGVVQEALPILPSSQTLVNVSPVVDAGFDKSAKPSPGKVLDLWEALPLENGWLFEKPVCLVLSSRAGDWA